jgi:hypothetical protein
MRQQKVIHLLEHTRLQQQLKQKAASSIAKMWKVHLQGKGAVEE